MSAFGLASQRSGLSGSLAEMGVMAKPSNGSEIADGAVSNGIKSLPTPCCRSLKDGWANCMKGHCCEDMQREVERVCEQHPNRHDCPDCLVGYSPRFREYGLLVHDGGSSSVRIQFCPWCGTRLPESLRDRWFNELEALGIDPGRNEVPPAFQSSAWWTRQEAGLLP